MESFRKGTRAPCTGHRGGQEYKGTVLPLPFSSSGWALATPLSKGLSEIRELRFVSSLPRPGVLSFTKFHKFAPALSMHREAVSFLWVAMRFSERGLDCTCASGKPAVLTSEGAGR